MISKNEAIDLIDKIDFFQGQRAGRELWNEKPRLVQEIDLEAFQRDVMLLREYVEASETPDEIVEEVKKIICENTYPSFDKNGKPVNVWKALEGYSALDALKEKSRREDKGGGSDDR